jgi:hypothetical protein
MTFEEFFKTKKINLAALENADGALFSDFKNHFEQMGEKSFDHAKKYWFNKLRREFPLPPEVKAEKEHIANPIAEQTITESLAETVSAVPSPKLGFVPKFKAGNMPKPTAAADDKKDEPPATKNLSLEKPAENAAKPAYKPRFNMKNIPPKRPEE